MRGGTLKRQSLVFEGKPFGSRGNNGGMFEVNQDLLSSEEMIAASPSAIMPANKCGISFLVGALMIEDEVIVAT